MGTNQDYAVLASGYDTDLMDAAFERVREFAHQLSLRYPLIEDYADLLVRVPYVINHGATYAVMPSGSKVGWDTADHHALLREFFVETMGPLAYRGVIQVQWGELGFNSRVDQSS